MKNPTTNPEAPARPASSPTELSVQSPIRSQPTNPILMTDLSVCEPACALGRKPARNQWRTVPYTTDAFSGTLLHAPRNARPPDITLHPRLRGWHAIHIGAWRAKDDPDPQARTQVKLTSDAHFITFRYDDRPHAQYRQKGQTEIVEVFWKYANLSDESIVISHPCKGIRFDSWITHFKFVPLPARQVDRILADRQNPENQRLFATHDIHGLFFHKAADTLTEILEDFEIYRYSDVGKVMLEYLTDPLGHFPPGAPYPVAADLTPRDGDAHLFRSLRAVRAQGIDVYRVITQFLHAMGKKVYLGLRMNSFAAEPPWDACFNTRFYHRHPQWRCRDIDGSEVARMSYAFPEVQDAVIGMLKRMVDVGVDGIHLLYCRGVPNLLYEAPLVERYRRDHGRDPRRMPEDDPHYLRFRTDVFSDFMRRVRKELDAYADQTPGRARPALAAYALFDQRTNAFFALDPQTWVRERLIDDLVIYPKVMKAPGTFYDTDAPIDVAAYASMLENSDVRLYVELLPREMEPDAIRRKAAHIYAAGADGISLWDTYDRVLNLRQWSMLQRLGHRDRLNPLPDEQNDFFRYLTIRTLNGIRIDKYSPAYTR